MKIKKIISVMIISMFMVLSTHLSAKSPKRKAEEMCNNMKSSGIKCKISRLRNCGLKWKRVKRFKKRGRKNYTVCVPGSRFRDAMKRIGKKIARLIKASVNIFKSACKKIQKKVPGMICSIKDLKKCPPGTRRIRSLSGNRKSFIPLCIPNKNFRKIMKKLGLRKRKVGEMEVYTK